MKKQHLKSLKLNKMIIAKAKTNMIKGGGITVGSDCISACLGHECQVHK